MEAKLLSHRAAGSCLSGSKLVRCEHFKVPSRRQCSTITHAVNRAQKAKAPAKTQQKADSSSGLVQIVELLGQPLAGVVGTPLFTALKIGGLVFTLGVVDAAYSGDWSRIGVITKETEHNLQGVVLVITFLHGLCGAAAGTVAGQNGSSWVVPAIKGFLFGTLGVYEETVEAKASQS